MPAFAAVPSAIEPDYADAILALHDGKPADALKALQNALKADPKQLESLALFALTEKTLGHVKEAKESYEKVLEVQQSLKASESAQAPYHFELGVLSLQTRDLAGADRHLTFALRQQFNVPATHYFLGVTAFEQKDWNGAELHFRATAVGGTSSLKPGAFYYLGQLAKRRNDAPHIVDYFTQSERWASADAETARSVNDAGRVRADEQIRALAAAELVPFRQARWFGQLGLSSGYDSNVLSAPDGTTGASGNATMRETLLWGLGYNSGTADGVQWVPSYRGSFNYDTNPDTKQGQFLTQSFTLYANPHAGEPQSWGVKAEAQVIFGYTDNDASLSPYSLIGSLGPYYRRLLSNHWEFRAELYAHPQDYFNDNLYPDTQARTGWGVTPRLLLTQQTGRGNWNPQVALVGDYTHTDGTEYQSKTISAELADTMYLDKKWSLELAGSLGVAAYPSRPGLARTDKLLTVRGTATRQISTRFALSGDVAYLADYSSEDTYKYTRFVTSLAMNYLF